MTPAQLTKLAIAALEDMKGVNIELIDVAPLTSIADHMVICTGTSNRHVKALADSVMEKAKEAGVASPRSQGLEQGDWALVDLNGTIIHIMQASARATYQLEKLWDLGQPKPRLDEVKKAKKLAQKAAKKSAAKPAPGKKPAAKKAAPKAAPAKKSVVVKPAAKGKAKPLAKAPAKPAAKKAAPKTVTAQKPTAKKAVAKKVAAPKTVTKGPLKVVKKSAVKKPVAKAKKR